MQALEYSDEAINALDAFLECDYILFVEGDDDVLFWSTVFCKCSDLSIDIRPVGGVNELKPYVDKVKAGELDCLVAKDADYTKHENCFLPHPRVLYTYGYSIENTLYKPELISSVIGLWSKRNVDCLREVNDWLMRFATATKPLFYLDYINYINNLELDTGAGHCQQFMQGRYSEEVDEIKLNEHVGLLRETHGISYVADELTPVIDIPVPLLMRGHFLQSAVLRFVNRKVKEFGRKANVSADALYAHAIHHLQNAFCWEDEEGVYYSKQVRSING